MLGGRCSGAAARCRARCHRHPAGHPRIPPGIATKRTCAGALAAAASTLNRRRRRRANRPLRLNRTRLRSLLSRSHRDHGGGDGGTIGGPQPCADRGIRSYEELDERTLAQLAKAPDDHIDRQAIVYGAITQLDAAAGKCIVRVSISDSPQDAWYDCEHNSVSLVSDGEADCLVLDPLRRDETSPQRRRRLSADPRHETSVPCGAEASIGASVQRADQSGRGVLIRPAAPRPGIRTSSRVTPRVALRPSPRRA